MHAYISNIARNAFVHDTNESYSMLSVAAVIETVRRRCLQGTCLILFDRHPYTSVFVPIQNSLHQKRRQTVQSDKNP